MDGILTLRCRRARHTGRGPGVPVDQRTTVFERFARGTDPSVPGTGLGLAVSQAIARAHGGEIVARVGGQHAQRTRHVLGQPGIRAELDPVGDLVQAYPQPEVRR